MGGGREVTKEVGTEKLPADFAPFRAALHRADESERYDLLATILAELAAESRADANGSRKADQDQLEALKKKITALGEEKATLEDSLATGSADLASTRKELEAKQVHVEELQKIGTEQRARAGTLQKKLGDIEAELTARNAELHRAEVENERLTLELQRAEAPTRDDSVLEGIEAGKRSLAEQVAQLRKDLDAQRQAKDGEIERLKETLAAAESGASSGGDKLLSELWTRLASRKPRLVEPGAVPTKQAAERLVDGFGELIRFVDEFDKGMHPFLTKYTRHHPSVKVPWDVYASRDGIFETACKTVAEKGRPIGVLVMRLRMLKTWMHAAMIASDSAIASIASELHTQLHGPLGTGSDPNRTIRDYLREDGNHLLEQRIWELLSERMADAFGRGG